MAIRGSSRLSNTPTIADMMPLTTRTVAEEAVLIFAVEGAVGLRRKLEYHALSKRRERA